MSQRRRSWRRDLRKGGGRNSRFGKQEEKGNKEEEEEGK